MCDDEEPTLTKDPQADKKCIKCREREGKVKARQPYCKECFIESYIHRFRSSLGKSRLITPGERVLLASSGGPSSCSMLQLAQGLLQIDEVRKRRVEVTLLVGHVNEEALFGDEGVSKQIGSLAAKYNLKFVSIGLEEIFSPELTEGGHYDQVIVQAQTENKNFDDLEVLLKKVDGKDPKTLLKEAFAKIKTVTAKEDLLRHLKNQLLVHLARKNKCTKIFTGENATRMAVNIMSFTSKGRGYTLPFETSFLDNRFPDLSILRPMKDILSKEIGFYNYYHQIDSFPSSTFTSKSSNPKISIDYLTEAFVTSLQKDFPSTVGAITKTADKFQFIEGRVVEEYCIICRSPKSATIDHWKRSIIFNPKKKSTGNESSCSADSSTACVDCSCSEKQSPVLDLTKYTCYSCQVSLRDYAGVLLPPVMAESVERLQQSQNSEKLRDQIKDFLIEEED